MRSVMSYPIIAYTERDSIDPVTCEEGKLRQEWAILATYQHYKDFTYFGNGFKPSDWKEYVLIARYIRRGQVEDWCIVAFYYSEDEALRGILEFRGNSG
jgi:hypothetical protein